MSRHLFQHALSNVGFTVRPGREAKFEKRWADRSSRLASLDGFKYFHLMRRVALEDEVNSGAFSQTSFVPNGDDYHFY